MFRLQRVLAIGVIVTCLMKAGPAFAPYHVLVIEEIFFGTEAAPNAQYVMLRTLAGLQVFVDNQKVMVQGADGAAAPEFGEFDALTNPRTERGVAILIGTPEAETLFGVTMDKVTSGRLVSPDGRICFGEWLGNPVDCVAFGDYTGTEPGSDTPAPAPVLGMALTRVANTTSDANDFQVAGPCPQNNAGTRSATCPTPTPTLPPSATPSVTVTPSPSATATLRPPPPLTDYVCPGDCNRDRTVLVNEVVTGVNIALARAEVESCFQADADRDGNVRVNELVSSVNSLLGGCRPLGTRRFSLDPQTSAFTAVLSLFGAFPNYGFTGYLELRAGVPAADGIAFIDIVDTSDYLVAPIAGNGGPETYLCIRPDRSALPIATAGVIDCDGGTPVGFSSVQDHNIGTVGTCTTGENAGEACAGDGDCPGGECFTAADCETAGGNLEESGDPHPGVCNGPLVATQITDDAGPGAVFIGPDPSGFFRGLPGFFSNETALPCGDEGGETETNFAFTTARSGATIQDLANTPGATFSNETTGTNFSCRDFDTENSDGTLVLDVPTFDLAVPILGIVDFISEFTLDD